MIPSLLAVASLLTAITLRRHVAPSVAARVVTAAMTTGAVAWVWLLTAIALQGIARLPGLRSHLGWCAAAYPLEHQIHPGLSVLSSVALVAIGITMRRTLPFGSLRIGPSASVGPLRLVRCSDLIAHAEPGSPGRIVVSTATLEALAEPERRALFAHEQSHLRHAHHRLLVIARASAVALPVLRPLVRVVRYLLERWADEDAAVEIGSRSVLARAMARLALAAPAPLGTLGFASFGVADRVRELLDPSPHRRLSAVAAWACLLSAMTIAVFVTGGELFRVVAIVLHICGSTSELRG